MLSKILSFGLLGLGGYPVIVETDISSGMPIYETVGLPGAAVRESKERVRSAIKNSLFEYPQKRITINLAPADTKKSGAIYDLPIAMGILCASGQANQPDEKSVLLGELSLDGHLRLREETAHCEGSDPPRDGHTARKTEAHRRPTCWCTSIPLHPT